MEYINWRRALIGGAVLAAVLVPLFVFVLSSAGDPLVSPPRLLDTPPAQGAPAETGLSEGKLAPDFELSQPDGSRVRLSEPRGRPVLINFWATWCGSCLSEMPVIKALQEEKGRGAFTVLAVNAGETRKEALRFINFLGAPFVYGLDTDMTVTDAYGVYGLPLSVFIDSTGVIQALYRGHAQRPLLEQFVAAAIAAQPPGPVAPVLRIISTIPRERVLTVDVHGDILTLSSKEFRCDPSYCGGPALLVLSDAPGVTSVDDSRALDGHIVKVRLDRRVTGTEGAVGALTAALDAIKDPLYEGPVRVEYLKK